MLLLHEQHVDIAVVTETWFSDATITAVEISQFSMYSKSRQDRRGGGVAVYVREHSYISVQQLPWTAMQ